MRLVPLVIAILVPFVAASAGEIREFDLKTTERLGNELVKLSKRADRGCNTPAKKRAKEAAITAVQGRLYDAVRYDYVVLDDPAGSGFLVYALAVAKKKGDIFVGGHYRVAVSGDGARAQRVDLLSQLIKQPKPPTDATIEALVVSQLEAKHPVETWIYSSDLHYVPIGVTILTDKSFWLVANGTIHKFTKAEIEKMESKPKKK
jgi:hypothetical protein